MTYVVGIDPGLDGALAVWDATERRVVVMIGMPVYELAKGKGTKRELAMDRLASAVESEITALGIEPRAAFLERVNAGVFGSGKEGQSMGVTSSFNFGEGYGALKMLIVLNKWPMELVPAAKWKRSLAVPAAKDDAVRRASALMPQDVGLWIPRRGVFNSKQASGRAEAAMIAYYGATQLGIVEPTKPRFVRRAG